jgi:hypothetical protein
MQSRSARWAPGIHGALIAGADIILLSRHVAVPWRWRIHVRFGEFYSKTSPAGNRCRFIRGTKTLLTVLRLN